MNLNHNNLKFLHCMQKIEYLTAAINQGLMFTDHSVEFTPTDDTNELNKLVDDVIPLLERRLKSIGLALEYLPHDQKNNLFRGLGSIRGMLPMICLTEIPCGKVIRSHGEQYGKYGLVLRPKWVMRNGADRVIYIGDNSPISRHIFGCIAALKTFSLYVDENRAPLFDNESICQTLNIFSYFETRRHIQEAEWRIVGKTGFMEKARATGYRLPLHLNDIEFIFVPDGDSIKQMTKSMEDIASRQKISKVPVVRLFPECISD